MKSVQSVIDRLVEVDQALREGRPAPNEQIVTMASELAALLGSSIFAVNSSLMMEEDSGTVFANRCRVGKYDDVIVAKPLEESEIAGFALLRFEKAGPPASTPSYFLSGLYDLSLQFYSPSNN